VKVVAEGLEFPEGPVALEDGSVMVVEIRRGTLTRVDARGSAEVVADLGGGPNGAAAGPDDTVYVCNNGGFTWHEVGGIVIPGDAPDDYVGGSIQCVHLASGRVDTLYRECRGRPLRGPNDLIFDGAGGFWFTDHGKSSHGRVDHGAIFYAACDGSSIEVVVDRLHGPNGIGLSPDGATLYWAETPTGRLWSRSVVAPGKLAPPRDPLRPGELVFTTTDYRLFDSLKVEQGGRICVGTLVSGGITVIDPSGGAEFVAFPEVAITNLAFGGGDLCDVWATASASGRLYRLRWPRPGLKSVHRLGVQQS
jgi:gluconolactonase